MVNSYRVVVVLLLQPVIKNGLGLIRRHFWAWLSLTNTPKVSESKYQVGFGVIISGQNPQTFMIPIYSTIWYLNVTSSHYFIISYSPCLPQWWQKSILSECTRKTYTVIITNGFQLGCLTWADRPLFLESAGGRDILYTFVGRELDGMTGWPPQQATNQVLHLWINRRVPYQL